MIENRRHDGLLWRLAICALVGVAHAGVAVAQTKKAPSADDLLAIVSRMAAVNKADSRKEFSEARQELSDKLFQLDRLKGTVDPNKGSELADKLIALYDARRSFDSGPDHLPISVAAKYGSSQKAKRYIQDRLKEPGDARKRALVSLAWTKTLKGDPEIYESLKALFTDDNPDRIVVLATMSRVDRKKALPLVVREAEMARDVTTFNKASDLICEYHDPALLDHVLPRVKDFPRAPWASLKNPTLGIHPELLLKYVEQAQGPKLQNGLDALEMSVDALNNAYPVLKGKLERDSVDSRRAVAKTMRRLSEKGAFRRPGEADDLDKIAGAESTADIRDELRKAAQQARKGAGRR